MTREYYTIYILVFIGLLSGTPLFSQNSFEGKVRIETEPQLNPSPQQTLIGSIVKIKNTSDRAFSGVLLIDTPSSLKAIAGTSQPVELQPSDSTFVSVRFLKRSGMEAGTSTVKFRLQDSAGNTLSEKTSTFVIEEKIQLNLVLENTNILAVNPNDSVRIKTIVGNRGNKSQSVTVVFSVPDLSGQINFIERKATIAPMEQHVFSFSFLPTKALLEKDRFVVNVVGLRGAGKEIFGNGSVTIQNVLSSRKFDDGSYDFGSFASFQQNNITVSYRRYGSSSDIFQLQGRDAFNLPAGSLSIQGNIYSNLTQSNQVVATNTALTYRLNQNELTLGNISETLELTMFGRGAKIALANEGQSRRFQVGVVDGAFNLFSGDPLFKGISSFYMTGQLGAVNAQRQFYGSYIYQDNPFEGARFNIVGSEMRWLIRNAWYTRLRVSGAHSNYDKLNKQKMSGAVDFQYNGHVDDLELNGAYYYSSAYFPGSRRGVLSGQQSISKGLGKGYQIRSNFLYSDFSPRYYTNTINSTFRNLSGEVGLSFPTFKTVSTSISYQNQYERSNSYYLYFTPSDANSAQTMFAGRFIERLTWMSRNMKHILVSSIENGWVKYPQEDKYHFQFKSGASYTYHWLNLNASYQQGSYYISEYALNMDKEETFNRLFLSAAVNKTFSDEKYEISAGANYSKDPLTGEAPSGFMNVRYNHNRSYSIFMNSSLYHYNVTNQSSKNIYNVEVGVTVHLPEGNISSRRKSKLSVFVYYDKNANNIYDKGDEPAPGFDIMINNTAFLSDNGGEFVYSQVPFGSYEVKPVSRKGWFYKGQPLVISKFKTKVQIPLQQAGTVSGKVAYIYDKKTTADMILKYSNIRFRIVNVDNEFVQRAITNDDGEFTMFLPTGDYKIILEPNTLEPNTYCEISEQDFRVQAGKIQDLPAFRIQVKHRKVNIKHFSDNQESDK